MTKICFILLCHKNPEQVVEQVNLLTGAGDYVSVHFDANGSALQFAAIREGLADNPNVCFAKRVKCGWGEWSLVQGTLNALETGFATFPEATHFYMLSGDCQPVKPVEYMHRFLQDSDKDYIEHHDFFESDWIKVGLKEERLVYRHWFNERTQKPLFYGAVKVQRALGLERDLPADLQIMIGSQWWVLRRGTIAKVLDLLKKRPDIIRFFRTTWIPDETFFQTLVLHLVPRDQVESRTLTFLSFSDYGLPTVFYGDHLDFLLAQDYLFARKISPEATDLKAALSQEFLSNHEVRTGPDGRRLIAYLNGLGRVGNRYGERFWERGSRIGRQNTLQVVLCKKWHVGKRFAEQFAQATGIRSLGYLFDESGTGLPDLGGLEHSRPKRNRHRRAFLKLMYERFETGALTICMDPSNLETLADFAGDSCQLRVLDVDCLFDDDYLVGHAQRIGLSDGATDETLLLALRNEIRSDREALKEMALPELYTIREQNDPDINALALAGYLKIPQHRAEKIAASLSFE